MPHTTQGISWAAIATIQDHNNREETEDHYYEDRTKGNILDKSHLHSPKKSSTSGHKALTGGPMLTLFIIRGFPGAGKSTLGEILTPGRVFAADDYFMVDGEYNFDPSKLGEAHAQCARNVKEALQEGLSCSVANTFSCRWEYEPYLRMAKKEGVRWYLIDLYLNGETSGALLERNVHGVPSHVYENMKERWEK